MSQLRAAARSVAGAVVLGGSLGALALHTPTPAVDPSDWRPRCAKAQGWGDVEVGLAPAAAPARWLLIGLDLSGSNAELRAAEFAAVRELVAHAPADLSLGLFVISERSADSRSPDLPYEPGTARPAAVVTGRDCAGGCGSFSLAQSRCAEQLDAAIRDRTGALLAEAQRAAEGFAAERRARIDAWLAARELDPPSPGTAVLEFFRKLAEHPAVREGQAEVTVLVLGDLHEAKTRDRARLDRALKAAAAGECPREPLVAGLGGARVVLAQGWLEPEAERWGRGWETILSCAGVAVTRQRFSPGLPLATALGEGW